MGCLIAMLFFVSCKNDDGYIAVKSDLDSDLELLLKNVSNGEGNNFFVLPSENDYAKIPQDPLNPITAEKVALGKMLVHETATGGNPKMEINKFNYACASCHPVAAGFYAGLLQGISEGGSGFGIAGEGRVIMPPNLMPLDSVDILPIKVPTLLNVAYQEVALWNGSLGGTGINTPFINQNASDLPDNLLGYEGLEVQGLVGQEAHRLKIDREFVETFGYKPMFDSAFPDLPQEDRYSRLAAGLAIAAFNRTVLANQAPWQDWLKGDYDALTTDQKKGAFTFFSNGKCYQCHTGPALKSNAFYAWGLKDFDPAEAVILNKGRSFKNEALLGRGGFTGREEDNYKFKVPTLYNLKMNSFYGHGGSFKTLREIVEYKVKGTKENIKVPDENLADQFGTISLTEEEITYLVDFIKNGLYDPNIERYAPKAVLSGNCIPNNDKQSRIDLGCE